MKRTIYGAIVILAVILAAGCAKPPLMPLEFTPQKFQTGKYEGKVDNFQVILDASDSMDADRQAKFKTAKNLATAINQSLPDDLKVNSGLRTFGHAPEISKEPTALPFGMSGYNKSGFQQSLEGVTKAGGSSPLSAAIEEAGNNLKAASGNSALIIVSDGIKMETAPAAMKKVKAELGDRICTYTVLVGDSAEGKKVLEEVATAGVCGFATTDSALTSPNSLGIFVEKALLAQKAPAPVPPPAPAPKPAPAPCPDEDGDGVCGDADKCPNTVPGAVVDENGCAIKYTLNIEFDFDKADIRPQYHDDLVKASDFIKRYPKAQFMVAGHTDSVGNEQYNKDLSKRRATSVLNYLVKNMGASASQLHARGYGETRPVASNKTKEGRQQNRRVEVICCVVVPPEE